MVRLNVIADTKYDGISLARDLSHPRRLEEQVALLIASGKECVGYRELLFWDTRVAQIRVDPSKPGPGGRGCLGTVEKVGEAWLYSNTNPAYCLATSLCYWRKTWEAKPFPDAMIGSEREWLKGLDTVGYPGWCMIDTDNLS